MKSLEITIGSEAFGRGTTEHGYVAGKIRKLFGNNVVLTGVDPSSIGSSSERATTFGVPIDKFSSGNLNDDCPLTYASDGDIIVYEQEKLRPLENYEYEVLEGNAVKGFVKLNYFFN